MSRRKVVSEQHASVKYPPGCRVVSDELTDDELIRRLKQLAHAFQTLSQGENESSYALYVPLASHLADSSFLNHHSQDVQLLIACCIVDILRIFVPEAPYKDIEQLKNVFHFLIRQLGGLKDITDSSFKRYFYLLENLAYVKSFNLCFDLEECNEIILKLFQLMFKIISKNHSTKIRKFMLEILCPLINDSDVVSTELLDLLLLNVVEPLKSQAKESSLLTEDIIKKTYHTLEPYVKQLFNQTLILGKSESKIATAKKSLDILYELNRISPNMLLAVLPQLQYKMKSVNESDRLPPVALLARMFSDANSKLAFQYKTLWQAFLDRFNDISVSIRVRCVQQTMHFLVNQPHLTEDIVRVLKNRQLDADESVRYEVVLALVTASKKEFELVANNPSLLDILKGRTMDKKFKIRKEARNGLALIYKKFISMHLDEKGIGRVSETSGTSSVALKHSNDDGGDGESDDSNNQIIAKTVDMSIVSGECGQQIVAIANKVLHGYYMPPLEDRLMVERLLNISLVPFDWSDQKRMETLLFLYANLDENASKVFAEIQKVQYLVRKTMTELVTLIKQQLTLHAQLKACKNIPNDNASQSIESVGEDSQELEGNDSKSIETPTESMKNNNKENGVDLNNTKEMDGLKKAIALNDVEVKKKIQSILRFITDAAYNSVSKDHVLKFVKQLKEDPKFLGNVQKILDPDISCSQSFSIISDLLKKLGPAVSSNAYYNCMKQLLQRMSCVMVDKQSILTLTGIVRKVLQSVNKHRQEQSLQDSSSRCTSSASSTDSIDILSKLKMNPETAGEKSLNLLLVLSFIFPHHFASSEATLKQVIPMLTAVKGGDHQIPTLTLRILEFVSSNGEKPLEEVQPHIMKMLVSVCKQFICLGRPKQAKHAIRCLHKNLNKSADSVFNEVMTIVTKNLNYTSTSKTITAPQVDSSLSEPTSGQYLTAIVCLGHIALLRPKQFALQLKTLVSRKIVKELIMKQDSTENGLFDSEEQQTPEDLLEKEEDEVAKMTSIDMSNLPIMTRCKVAALKMMARWLLGMASNKATNDVGHGNAKIGESESDATAERSLTISAQKTFRMLTAVIESQGDILEEGNLSPVEMSCLRLSAGCAMLKVCEEKGVGDKYTLDQFYTLTSLFSDSVHAVRKIMFEKLSKGLSRAIPYKCLPEDFLGIYVLAGLNGDEGDDLKMKNVIKQKYVMNITRRIEYVKSAMVSGKGDLIASQLSCLLPDYLLLYAIPILASHHTFTAYTDFDTLERFESALTFVMQPLISGHSGVSGTLNPNFSFNFYKSMLESVKVHVNRFNPIDMEVNYKIWAVCDLAMSVLFSKTPNFQLKEYPRNIELPRMFYQPLSSICSKVESAQTLMDNSNFYCYIPKHLKSTRKLRSSKNEHLSSSTFLSSEVMSNERPPLLPSEQSSEERAGEGSQKDEENCVVDDVPCNDTEGQNADGKQIDQSRTKSLEEVSVQDDELLEEGGTSKILNSDESSNVATSKPSRVSKRNLANKSKPNDAKKSKF